MRKGRNGRGSFGNLQESVVAHRAIIELPPNGSRDTRAGSL